MNYEMKVIAIIEFLLSNKLKNLNITITLSNELKKHEKSYLISIDAPIETRFKRMIER